MKIQLDTAANQNRIRHYGAGSITVNQAAYAVSIVVLPEQVVEWPPQRFADLSAGHFELLRALNPEVVLLGTGSRLQFPAPALTRSLAQSGIGLEVMDTGAACRTYNVLAGEGRRVAAALLMLDATGG